MNKYKIFLVVFFLIFLAGKANASVGVVNCTFSGSIDTASVGEMTTSPNLVVFNGSGNEELTTGGCNIIGGYYHFDKNVFLKDINFADKTTKLEFKIESIPSLPPTGPATISSQYFLYSVNGKVINIPVQNFSKHQLSRSYGGMMKLELNSNLGIGTDSGDVQILQSVVLNTDKDTKVSETGAGSPGKESTYFGAKTKQAVIKFQKKHGIVPASGFVGPMTRAYINKLGYSY
jgi:hypothetical protein